MDYKRDKCSIADVWEAGRKFGMKQSKAVPSPASAKTPPVEPESTCDNCTPSGLRDDEECETCKEKSPCDECEKDHCSFECRDGKGWTCHHLSKRSSPTDTDESWVKSHPETDKMLRAKREHEEATKNVRVGEYAESKEIPFCSNCGNNNCKHQGKLGHIAKEFKCWQPKSVPVPVAEDKGEQVCRWVSVKERLPKKGVDVFAIDEDMELTCWCFNGVNTPEACGVAFWMENLPVLPTPSTVPPSTEKGKS
jgi:hypothetical protein